MPTQEYLIVNYLSIKDITRIFRRIKVMPSGCWEWQGARLKQSGYGVIRYQHRVETVHRLLFAWTVEPLPQRKRGEPFGADRRELDHFYCSNKRCCNPAHLRLVTHAENSLRSNSPLAINSQKTHCVRGHLLPSVYTEKRRTGNGTRRCIPCRRINSNRRYHERRTTSSTTPH